MFKKTYHKFCNMCSGPLPNPKEKEWGLPLWYNEGWTKRAHYTKIFLNKTVHVYMYKKTHHKLFNMCSVSLPNPKKKWVLSLRFTWGMNQVGTLHQNIAKNKTVQVFMYKKTYHKLFNKSSVSLSNPKERGWVLPLWYAWEMKQVSSLHLNIVR